MFLSCTGICEIKENLKSPRGNCECILLLQETKKNMFVAAKELDRHPAKFKLFYRMSKELFLELVEKVIPQVEKIQFPKKCEC